MRKKSTTPQPVKPRLLLYSRSISDMDELGQESEWKLIAYSQVSGQLGYKFLKLVRNLEILQEFKNAFSIALWCSWIKVQK